MPGYLGYRFFVPANNVENVLIGSADTDMDSILKPQAIPIADPCCFLEIQNKPLATIVS